MFKPLPLFFPHTNALVKTDVDQNLVSLLADSSCSREDGSTLDSFDSQSLQAMLARIESMSTRIKSILGDHSSVLPPSPTTWNPTANHRGLGDAASPQSTRADHGVSASTTYQATDADASKKNLPSPAATEDVAPGNSLEDKPKENGLAEEHSLLPRLPAEANTKIDEDGYALTDQPSSDDKTAVENQVTDGLD